MFLVWCPSSGAGCDITYVSIYLCVGLMAISCRVTSYSGFFSVSVYLLFLSRGVVCLGCWWSFSVFRCHCVLCPFEANVPPGS
jgi:hypothetical protein